MQRVISLQTSRNADRGSSEFVTKRLCCSFLFSVAFLSLLGGFLLGRYATDRAILLKNVALQHKQQTEERFTIDIMNNLTSLMQDIHRSIGEVHVADMKVYYRKLICADSQHVNATNLEAKLQNNISVKTTYILNLHLNALNSCFTDIYLYLDEINQQHNKTTLVTTD